MQFVAWCKLFEMDHPFVDEEHRKLFEIANSFYSEIDKGADIKVIRNTLHNLTVYAQTHFDSEETVMMTMVYPFLEEHKEIHVKLMMDIFELNASFENGDIKCKDEISDFLKDWLVIHILVEDKKFHAYRNKLRKERKVT